jgi:hypothetical protein
MNLACVGRVEIGPNSIQRFGARGVQRFPENGNEGEPVDGALVRKGLLESLPLELLEEYSIFIESLREWKVTF